MWTEPIILTISFNLAQAFFALIVAVLVRKFYLDYDNKYFYFWIWSWGTFAIQLIGSCMPFLEGFWFDFDHPISLFVAIVTAICSYLQVLFLFVGFYELSFRKQFSPFKLKIIVQGIILFSITMVMIYFDKEENESLRLFFRLGVKEFFFGLFFTVCSVLILLYRRGIAMKFVMVSFLLYGGAQFHYLYLHLTILLDIDYLDHPFYLGVFDLLLTVFLGIGLVMAVLELESRRLRKVNEELDVFLYRSAHDLRAPLMGVKGVLSLMDMSQESNQTELEHLVVQEIDKADHVIREIVTLRQSQKKSLTISYLNLKDIIVRVIEDLNQKMVVSKSIQFDIMLDHLSSFYSDKGRLYDVLYRLISNAVIYHDLTRENPKITIDFRVLKGKVMLSIADNGKGMDAKYLPYIFDMFYRVSKDSKGPGLGLYLAKEMMSQLQGTINVESERSVGTTMKVLLKDLKDATHA